MADRSDEDDRVPVTILTGFLGSGKTTLLNHILKQKHGLKIAVIENEYGEVGIDDVLVRKKFQTKEEIFEMNNGCICCTVRGDLIRILSKILSRDDKFDAIVIETTGLADPSPVAQTFFVDEKLSYKARLDGIITVVDAKHIEMHIDEKKVKGVENEAVEQICFADRLLVNKTDLVTRDELRRVQKRLRELNPHAKQMTSHKSKIPLKEILGIRAFDLDMILKTCDPDFLRKEDEAEDAECSGKDCSDPSHHHHHDHHHHNHDDDKEHHHDHDHHQHDHHSKDCDDAEASKDSTDDTAKARASHQHDTSIRSVGVKFEGELDMDMLQDWIGELLKSRGSDIYRMKGVFAVRGLRNKFVFQGVHMTLDSEALEDVEWQPGETKMNLACFIGKNLDADELNKGLRACLASE